MVLETAVLAFEMAEDRRGLRYLAVKVAEKIDANHPGGFPAAENLKARLRKIYSYYWKLLPSGENDGATVPNAAVLTGFNPKA